MDDQERDGEAPGDGYEQDGDEEHDGAADPANGEQVEDEEESDE